MKRITLYSIVGGSVCLLSAMVLAMIFFPSSTQKKQVVKASAEQDQHQNQQDAFSNIVIKNFTLSELEKGRGFEIIVNAQECRFIQASDMVECANVTCTLLDHKNTTALLKTGKAFVNRSQKTIFLSGSVEGLIKELIVHGSDINYNFSQQTLQSNKAIFYHHPDFDISSQQSFIDLKKNRIELSGGVINEFKAPDKQPQP